MSYTWVPATTFDGLTCLMGDYSLHASNNTWAVIGHGSINCACAKTLAQAQGNAIKYFENLMAQEHRCGGCNE